MLKLASLEPIAKGGHRLVYQHPDDDAALVKILRDDVLKKKSALKRWLYAHIAYYHPYLPILNEIAEYFSLRLENPQCPAFLPRLMGMVETDVGFGLVVEKITGADGSLAPNLKILIAHHGLTDEMRRHIEVFCLSLLASKVVVSDLSPTNIVLAHDARNGSRLVLVDGLGEKTFIRLNRLSSALNRRSSKGRVRRLWDLIEKLAATAATR